MEDGRAQPKPADIRRACQALRSRDAKFMRLTVATIAILASAFVVFPAPQLAHAQSASTSATTNVNRNEAGAQLATEAEALKQSESERAALEAQKIELTRERAKLSADLIKSAADIKTSEAALTQLEARLAELEGKKGALVESLRAQYRSLSKLLAALQRMGRNPPPVIATPEEDALGMVRSAMLIARVFPELRSKADALAAKVNALNRVVADIESETTSARLKTARLKEQRQQMTALLDTKRDSLSANQTALQRVQAAVERYRRSVANLEELIANLDRTVAQETELAEYQRELEAGTAPGQAGAPPPKAELSDDTRPDVELAPKSGSRVAMAHPGRLKPAIPFHRAKGELPLPASGRRLWGFGGKTKLGNRSKGIAIETRLGAQVTSPNDGWVVYAGPFLSYRQLLIINGGGGYHILLAGLSKLDVQVGQFVLSGEPVGQMRIDASQDDGDPEASPVLYVEFRKKDRPIDPDPWWAVGS